MNIIRTGKAARSGWIGTGVVILLLAFSAALGAQERDKKPSKPAPTHSAPSHSAPSPRETPHASEAPHPGGNNSPANNAGHNPGNTAAPNNRNGHPGGTTVYTPNNRPANNAPPANNGNNRPGGGAVSPNNRPGGNNPPNNGYNRPGGNNTPNNSYNRPGGNNPPNNGGGFNNRPGGFNAGSGNGRSFPAKATIYHAPGGGQVQTRADGSIREVHTANGAIIHHAPDGARRVEVVRPGGRVIVANARGAGYVQRPLVVGNRTFIQRTYVVNHVSYARVYRPWVWGGVSFSVYTPVRFYSPGFYAYAYSPWARPIAYGWGWGGSPWFGFYGGWFTPYPTYASPAFWLTDYLIAQSLQDAYQARMADAANAQAANYGATPLTPDVKQAVADEVRRQLDQERAEQQNMNAMQASGPPPIFSGNGPHVFVVANALDVDSGGQTCPVTAGDVLQLNSPPPPNSAYAQVVVLASKGLDCRKGSMVSVALADLQEMQNQMRATIDQGLGDLQSKQGQGGLPPLPPSAAGPATNAPYAAQVQPDATAAADLSQASQEADRAEQDVVNQSMTGAGGAAGGPPATVALGQSIQDVEAIMGKPSNVADLGSKKIYVYRDLKITFVDGKVTDVQ